MEEIIIIIMIIALILSMSAIAGYIKFSIDIKKIDNQTSINKTQKQMYQPQIYQQQRYPYHRIDILTGNEREFYNKLKQITYGKFDILAKIRLADLVNVNQEIQRAEWGTYFSKISSKHIDFAIAKDMRIILLIELDDSSHWRRDRQERDIFVNEVMYQCGYRLIRTSGSTEPILNAINEMEFNKK